MPGPLRVLEGLVLRMVAFMLGVRVTSWIRTPEHNAEVGGLPTSSHLWGGAIDVGRETTEAQREVLRRVALEVDEVSSKGHWHYQVDGRALPLLAASTSVLVVWWTAWRARKEAVA